MALQHVLPTVAHSQLNAAQFVSGVATGHSGAGSVTLAGAKVGDRVLEALDLTDSSDVRSSFEATISVAGHIAQTTASDLSAKTIAFRLLSQS
jgi:hypothetical protein